MILFPNLTIKQKEKDMHQTVEHALVNKIQHIFSKYYELCPQIKCTGSTNKGTALPERDFGIDYDSSVLADETLVDLIAYKSNEFEGCQLFSLNFFKNFGEEFVDLYFAGHRISGKVLNRKFDFSITDANKDKWKWDFNSSDILKFSVDELEEVKKTKFFLKNFNVYGSEIYGVVGPAVELGIHYNSTFNSLIKKFRDFSLLKSDAGTQFESMDFPREYYELFEKSDNYVNQGLVKSFRFTTPNTYNRLIKVSKLNSLNLKDYVRNENLNKVSELNTDNERLVSYVLRTNLQNQDYFQIDLLNSNGNIQVWSSGTSAEQKRLMDICNEIDEFCKKKEFGFNELSDSLKKDSSNKLSGLDLDKYVFFIGSPKMPLVQNNIYIPVDFLIRPDAEKLIKVMEYGQNATK